MWSYEAIALLKNGRMGAMVVDGLLDDAPTPAGAPKERKRKPHKPPAADPGGAAADRLEDVADSLAESPDGPTFRDVSGEEIARLQAGLPENPADLPVARCAVPVDAALAAGLTRAWRSMLAEVGPDSWQQGLDGTSYNFAMAVDRRIVEGETWSPRPKTRPARLAALAEAMRDHCEKPDPTKLARIAALVRRLAAGADADGATRKAAGTRETSVRDFGARD